MNKKIRYFATLMLFLLFKVEFSYSANLENSPKLKLIENKFIINDIKKPNLLEDKIINKSNHEIVKLSKISNSKKNSDNSISQSISINYLSIIMEHYYYNRISGCQIDKNCDFYPSYRRFKSGFGIDYGLSFNHNNFIIEPKLFYDSVNFKVAMNSSSLDLSLDSSKWCENSNIKINDLFGSKLNIGYKINNNFSAFLLGGVANVRYSSKLSPCVHIDITEMFDKSYIKINSQKNNQLVPFYGFGFQIILNKTFSIISEYNIYKMQINPLTDQTFEEVMLKSGSNPIPIYKVKFDTFKLGMNFSF
jgi:hypothetical protein